VCRVRLLSRSRGSCCFHGAAFGYRFLTGQVGPIVKGRSWAHGPMPLLLGPEIGPLNLGRSKGDSSSAWAFNSAGPKLSTFSLFLSYLRQQTTTGCCLRCKHSLRFVGFLQCLMSALISLCHSAFFDTAICKSGLLRTYPLALVYQRFVNLSRIPRSIWDYIVKYFFSYY
jgi:hypothetical protein